MEESQIQVGENLKNLIMKLSRISKVNTCEVWRHEALAELKVKKAVNFLYVENSHLRSRSKPHW